MRRGGPAKEDMHAIIQSGEKSVKIEEFLKMYSIEQLSLKSSSGTDFMACQNAHHSI